MNIKYLIFDMDGTLIDSMKYWQRSGAEIADKYIPGSFNEIQDDLITISSTDVMKKITEKVGKEKGENFKKDWKERMEYYYLNEVELKDGVIEFLEYAKKQGLKMGIATSTPIVLAKTILQKFDLVKYFDAFVDENIVNGVGKSSPDIYNKCLEELGGRDHSEAVVFEDNVKYMGTVKNVGYKAVGVYDIVSKDKKDLALKIVDKYIVSFKELIK